MGKQEKKSNKRIVGIHRRNREPVDYGVTEDQFYKVLEKVSQPVKKSESDSEIVQTSE